MAPALRKQFLGNCGADEKQAVKAFGGLNAESALKTKPKVRGSIYLGFAFPSLLMPSYLVLLRISERMLDESDWV